MRSGGRRRTCDELVLWTTKWIFTGAWDDSAVSAFRAKESEIEKRKMEICECVEARPRWRRDEWEITGSGRVIRRYTGGGGDKSGGSPEKSIFYLLYFILTIVKHLKKKLYNFKFEVLRSEILYLKFHYSKPYFYLHFGPYNYTSYLWFINIFLFIILILIKIWFWVVKLQI